MHIRQFLLPEKEKQTAALLQSLPLEEKRALWRLIKASGKDHTCIVTSPTPEIRSLETKKILERNPYYRGKGFSYFTLRHAPYLMKQLQEQSKST
ncbi:hypothetical protein [Alkalicoccus urumqiensis]|uniref:Uncharacterized protein n=1 Tax=Alkalicoccus urumqiensis TaxID=1548213 RepID=A0A2P6MEY4_ALKUR|nr:hypothetical protein [Alkalicoccus urumqiensis]PRO64807.1 hypothetical protein C6I21_12925 [Alkalicoccus urumqiensis]